MRKSIQVHGTTVSPTDSKESYRNKIARITLDSIGQFVGLLDADGNVLEINKPALDAVGLRLSDVEGKPFWTTFWWQVSDEINQGLRDAVGRAARGEFVRWDTAIYGRAGGKETILIEASLRPILDDNGKVVFIAAEGRDITEKKAYEREIARQREELAQLDGAIRPLHGNPAITRILSADDNAEMRELARVRRVAEEAGRRERERIEFLTDAAQIGVWFCDLPFDKLEWDHRVKEHFWLPPDAEVSIATFYEKLHPEDRERTRLAIEESIAQKSRYEIDYRTVAPDGRIKWIRAIGHSHFDIHNNPIRFDGVTMDITPRVHADLRNRFLVSLDDALRPLTDPREITLTAARVLGEYLQVDRCAYADVEADADTMNLTGNYVRSPEIKSIVGRLKFSDFGREVLRLMREDAPFVVDDVDHHQPPVGDPSAYRATQIRAVVCVPLHKAGRFVAAMAVHMATPRAWEPEDVELVRAVAARCWESIERARLERGLQESEEHFRAFVTTSSAVVYRTNADWSEMRFLNGRDFIPDPTVPERSWLEKYVYPADRPSVLAAIQKAIDAKSILELEHRVIRGDGRVGWTYSRAIPLLDGRGEITEWLGAAANITDRRLAEEKLREQTRVLELLKDTGTAIAAELDLQSLVQIVTDAATKLCGANFGAFFYNTTNERGESYVLYTLSGAPREAFEQFGMPRNTPVFHPTFAGEGVVRSDDITADPRYGKMAPHYGMPKGHLPVRSYLAVPVTSRTGGVIGGLFFGHPEKAVFTEQAEELVSGIAAQASIAIDNATLYQAAQREIAERKRVAEALQQAREKLSHHAEELEKQVALRTSSLQEALAQLEEFSYSVSHDLRAPLRAIAGYNNVIREDYSSLLPAEAIGYLDRIDRSAHRMERLVNDVLTMSRVARAEIKLHRIDLQQFIEDIVEQHPNMQAAAAEISIQAPHAVLADDVPLSQALTNLLSNAVKFVDPGVKPQIIVRSEKVGQRVRIWVEDSGIGIPERHRDKLFGMFQRLPAKAQVEGNGIGLAIVRKAVERMGGEVGMEPNVPRGSRFWIELEGKNE